MSFFERASNMVINGGQFNLFQGKSRRDIDGAEAPPDEAMEPAMEPGTYSEELPPIRLPNARSHSGSQSPPANVETRSYTSNVEYRSPTWTRGQISVLAGARGGVINGGTFIASNSVRTHVRPTNDILQLTLVIVLNLAVGAAYYLSSR